MSWIGSGGATAVALLVASVAVCAVVVRFLLAARSRRASQALRDHHRVTEEEVRRRREAIEESADPGSLAATAQGGDTSLGPLAASRLQALVEQTDPQLTGITDQAVLAAIATGKSFPPRFRRRAIQRLDDAAVLARIARDGAWEASTRLAAVERLADSAVARELAQDLLRRVPHYSEVGKEDLQLLTAVIGKLTDPSALAAIAVRSVRREGPPTPLACVLAAVARIDDPQILKAICIDWAPRFSAGEGESVVCDAALARITDEALLVETASAVDSSGLGGRHLRLVRARITDESLRAKLDLLLAAKEEESRRWSEQP